MIICGVVSSCITQRFVRRGGGDGHTCSVHLGSGGRLWLRGRRRSCGLGDLGVSHGAVERQVVGVSGDVRRSTRRRGGESRKAVEKASVEGADQFLTVWVDQRMEVDGLLLVPSG